MPTRGLFELGRDMGESNPSIGPANPATTAPKSSNNLQLAFYFQLLTTIELAAIDSTGKQNSGRRKNLGNLSICAFNISKLAARKVTCPTFLPGRGDFPYKCKCASGIASTSAASGTSPIKFSIAEAPSVVVAPSGIPSTALK